MTRLLNATPALILLALGIWLVLTGRPQAHLIVIGATPGPWLVACDGDTVAAEADSVALVVECGGFEGAWLVDEWVSAGECGIEWRAE